MGITHLAVTVSNPTNFNKSTDLRFLIDSGATYSVISGEILEKLGIKSEEEREFILANGEAVRRKMGGARFVYRSHSGHAPVVFGEKGDSLLLGATALGAMGMILNPIKRELVPLPMLLG